MKKFWALRTIFRSPLKTIVTFFLIAAASFTLFSRLTEYVVTGRETANAKSFYHGVGALDHTVPEMLVEWEDKGVLYSEVYESGDKSLPTEEQLKEFSSLPGVSLTDRRYMTAGLVEGYRRVVDESYGEYSMDYFILEGTYQGYENGGGLLYLKFDDITVLASECELPVEKSVTIEHIGIEEFSGGEKNAYPENFWSKLRKGSRVLVRGKYWSDEDAFLTVGHDEKVVRILDGVGEDYLDTERFVYYKQLISAINQDQDIYDVVYTSDMRAIPRFNERKMVMAGGRHLVEDDRDACVVSELFLETYNLSVGDKISVRLGDRLFSQHPLHGAKARGDLEHTSNFGGETVLEIVGSYRFVDNLSTRVSESEWSYSSSTVFVPASLLPIEVPSDHELSIGEFSVFVEDARDIVTFREAAEPFAAKLGVALCFSDGGWLGVKNSFQTGALASLLTTVLYALGAVLALLLAIYLYVGRNKETYAIMRAMGVPGGKAGGSLVLPLSVLSVIAIPTGGLVGLFYTSQEAVKSLRAMADNAVDDYIPDTTLPVGIIVMCLLCELLFTSSVTVLFLRRMKKIPVLELLQGHTPKMNADTKTVSGEIGKKPVPAGYDLKNLPALEQMELSSRKKYNALRHVVSYVLRHIRRSGWKSAVSLVLTAVLISGIGMLALTRLTYQDAFCEVDVNATALDFASSNIAELSKSELVEEVYCYNTFGVRTNGLGLNTPMLITNDLTRYLSGEHIAYTAVYADGYDSSALNGVEPVCMIGTALAKTLGIRPGEEIALLSDSRYAALSAVYKEEKVYSAAAEEETVMYKVIGIIECTDEAVGSSIFAGINGPVEDVYSQPFPFGYCECKLVDNRRLDELNLLLTNLKNINTKYAPQASFYIDSEALEDIVRIRSLLEGLFPIAVVAALLIGLAGQGLVILQSAKEASFLRLLGVTKRRARFMLTLEQMILCMIGITLVTVGLVWYSPGLFARSTQTLVVCYALYVAGCLCGGAATAVWVTGHKVLELLQVKE